MLDTPCGVLDTPCWNGTHLQQARAREAGQLSLDMHLAVAQQRRLLRGVRFLMREVPLYSKGTTLMKRRLLEGEHLKTNLRILK